jgi:hypothetical protein
MPNAERMGGGRQLAGKSGHSDFVRNPEIQKFLSSCSYMREPNASELEALRKRFMPAPDGIKPLPDLVIAIDGSPYESAFYEGLPNTRAGYIKVSGVAVNLAKYKAAAQATQRTVDPFALASIFDGRGSLTFCLPSSNMEYGGATSVRHGFRRRLFEEFSSTQRCIPGRPETLLDTLFRIAELTPIANSGQEETHPKGGKLAGGSLYIRVAKCPTCGCKPTGGFQVPQAPGWIVCGQNNDGLTCDSIIYGTDALRVHETVTSQGANLEAVTRTMNVLESVFLAHYLLYLWEVLPDVLSNTCFVVDGPLAMFGEAAWMHGGMLRLYHLIQNNLAKRGLRPFLLFGLQKGGQVVDHANMVAPHLIEPDKSRQSELLLSVSDDYRSEFIKEREDNGGNFGDETYWGHDFIYRASNGDMFVVGLPYFSDTKRVADPAGILSAEADFRTIKSDQLRYPTLARALDVIRTMRSDLYQSSIVPILAAHQEASISLVPGGRVLDLLAHLNFATNRNPAK